MLKRILLVAVILAVFVLMIWFTSINPGTMTIDLAFLTVEPTIALGLAVTFVLGWVFGILCASFYALKLLNERRRLRATVRSMETEVSSLRNLPIADAD